MDLREQLQTTLSNTYSLERELSGGGMSRVFVAHETALGRRVVVKVLPFEASGAVSIERFKREIALAARLQHPHIVPLLASGQVRDVPYFTMPYVDGESLRDRLSRDGEFPLLEGMRLLREVASALAYAHSQGVVHRDIKPDNVLLSAGSAMVTDFGVAKAISDSSTRDLWDLTSVGVALGTPAYMAPEQATADPTLDHRADIYSFGILAYEVLTGQTPFAGRPGRQMFAAHVSETPEPISRRRANIPAALGALVMRCLEKRPADRPQTAQEILRALDDVNMPSGGTVLARSAARRRIPILAGVAVLALGVVAAWALTRDRLGATAVRSDDLVRSIAVLQLENASADTGMKFFVVGTTAEIATALGKIPGIRIPSRSVTDNAPGANAQAKGAALGVAAVFEGQVFRDRDSLRLTLQLTRVADGLSLWSESYHVLASGAFAVQDSIARAVASALKIKLSATEQAKLVSSGTKSTKAHDLYLHGRYLQREFNESSLRRSIELFEQALVEDSTYAAAYSGIADSWGILADDFMPPRETWRKSKAARDRGLAIDPNDPSLLSSAATGAIFREKDPKKAVDLFSRSMRADSASALRNAPYYAMALRLDGRGDSARVLVRRMIADTMDLTSVNLAASAAYYYLGDSALGEEICAPPRARAQLGCRLLGAHFGNRYQEERALLDSLLDAADGRREKIQWRTWIAAALARAGRTSEARRVAEQVDREVGSSYYREDVLATMWAEVGDATRAYYWLERAKKSESGGIPLLDLTWKRFPIREDPRIAAFIRANSIVSR